MHRWGFGGGWTRWVDEVESAALVDPFWLIPRFDIGACDRYWGLHITGLAGSFIYYRPRARSYFIFLDPDCVTSPLSYDL
jgi:hypothetical protein